MTKKTIFETNARLQKESTEELFKQNARIMSLEKSAGIINNTPVTAERIIEDAEKIYQWLIKGF